MNKWFKYILISTIAMFIGFNGVDAKTCEYTQIVSGGMVSSTDSYLDVTITIDDSNPSSKPSAVINGYKNKSSISNNEKVVNWDKNLVNAYKSTGRCPTYATVKKSGGYKVYLNYNKETAKKHCTLTGEGDVNYGKNCVMATSGEYKSTDTSAINNCKKIVAEYTTIANSQAEFEYTTDGCKDVETGKKYTAYSKCKKIASGMLSVSKEHDSEVRSCVANGYLSSDDSIVKNYEAAYKKAISNLESFKSTVESETKNYQEGIDTTKATEDYADSCDDAGETIKLLKQIYNLLRYLIPVLIIGLSIVDFIKVVATGEDKVFKEVWTKFVKRIVIGIVILILPAILSLIINLSGITNTYGVDPNNIFCILK